MPRAREQQELDWAPVVGRALAFLCLHYAEMRPEPLLDQAAFLARFGIPRSEAATLLGTTDESLSELARQRRKRSGSRKGTAQRRKPQAKAGTTRGRKR
jgi:hypothetical protein